MGLLRDLFAKQINSRDLKLKLREVDRERRRVQLEMRKLQAKQAAVLDRLKRSRKDGNNLETDYLFEDFKATKAEIMFARREARRANLEGITLKRYVRYFERLEAKKDESSLRSLLERLRTSKIHTKIEADDIDEQEYLAELQDELDTLANELSLSQEDMDGDPEKRRLMADLDEIIEAEEAGNFDVALEKETKLREQDENEQPEKDFA